MAWPSARENRSSFPERKLRLPPRVQAGVLRAVRLIPAQQLRTGSRVLPGIDEPQQCGTCQPARAEVVDKIDERVELALREPSFDQAGHLLLGHSRVVLKQHSCAWLCNSRRKGLVRQ